MADWKTILGVSLGLTGLVAITSCTNREVNCYAIETLSDLSDGQFCQACLEECEKDTPRESNADYLQRKLTGKYDMKMEKKFKEREKAFIFD